MPRLNADGINAACIEQIRYEDRPLPTFDEAEESWHFGLNPNERRDARQQMRAIVKAYLAHAHPLQEDEPA